jgi:hypothetical protein
LNKLAHEGGTQLLEPATPYKDFTARLKLFANKYPELISITLSNIFTMRLIGNKTHGDLAEIGIAEFINQYMYDFRSIHVGKDLYRAKSQEEDITVINELTNEQFSVSLKAYGDGPLQLSTDKTFSMFRRLEQEGEIITDRARIQQVLDDPIFAAFNKINVLPLIYDEKAQRCNILVFDYSRVRDATARIVRVGAGSGRKHPVYKFYGDNGEYICEVRYGDATANALQRGLWTHTQNALDYFDSITGGWIDYSHNRTLVRLIAEALVCSEAGHEFALTRIDEDIVILRQRAGIAK